MSDVQTSTQEYIPAGKRNHGYTVSAFESTRPYRLWDAMKKRAVRYRYYSKSQRAHWGALKELRWSAVGTTIEVYNANNGRLLGQYTRHPTSISFKGK